MRQQRIKRNEAKLAELGLLVALAPRTSTNRRKHVVMQDLTGSLDNLALAATSDKTALQQLPMENLALTTTVSTPDIGRLINLGTQHDGRSARTWMKRVLTTFFVVMGGRKGFAREHQNGFYET